MKWMRFNNSTNRISLKIKISQYNSTNIIYNEC